MNLTVIVSLLYLPSVYVDFSAVLYRFRLFLVVRYEYAIYVST